MVTFTLVPHDTKLVIEIPPNMVNKSVHVEVWTTSVESIPKLPKVDPRALSEINAFFDKNPVDLSGFQFNRDEINER